MSRYNNSQRDPREIVVKYKRQCAETGTPLNVGDTAIYYPTSKQMYSINSTQASTYYAWLDDLARGCDY